MSLPPPNTGSTICAELISGPWPLESSPLVSHSWAALWLHAWNAFWFAPTDPLPLGLVRIATGLLLAWSSTVWLLDTSAFFGTGGWLPAENVWRMNDQPWQWSLYFPFSSESAVFWVTLITLLAAVLLTIGLATPLAAVVALVGFISASNRAPLNVFGFDDVLGMLLIGLVVGPAGAACSVDSQLWRGRGWRLSSAATLAIRLIQVHLCVIYFFSGCGKLLGATWWEGTALWGAIANLQYRTLDLMWLAGHPLVVNVLTLTTLFWEVLYPVLIWPRLTRRLVLAMAVMVHMGIGLSMGMMEFGLVMLVANMAFMPASVCRKLLCLPVKVYPAIP